MSRAHPEARAEEPVSSSDVPRQVLETPCDRVRIIEPAGTGGDVYWRVEWYDEDGVRHQTTGGRTMKSAQAKAAKVLQRLDDAVKAEGRE